MSNAGTEIIHSLGGIIELGGDRINVRDTLGSRVGNFERADLEGVLEPDIQADLSDALRSLVPFRNRLEHDQWDSLQPLTAESGVERVVGFGEAYYIESTLPTIEIIAGVFADTSDALQALDTALTTRVMMDLPVGNALREHRDQTLRAISRVTTRFAPEWRWIAHRLER